MVRWLPDVGVGDVWCKVLCVCGVYICGVGLGDVGLLVVLRLLVG